MARLRIWAAGRRASSISRRYSQMKSPLPASRACTTLPGVGEVEDAVVHHRRRLRHAGLHTPRPREPQLADVAPVDLVEGAVAPPVEGAPPAQPVGGVGVLEHRVGDRRQLLHLRIRRLDPAPNSTTTLAHATNQARTVIPNLLRSFLNRRPRRLKRADVPCKLLVLVERHRRPGALSGPDRPRRQAPVASRVDGPLPAGAVRGAGPRAANAPAAPPHPPPPTRFRRRARPRTPSRATGWRS